MDFKVSFIIPVFNRENTIKRCIESILKQEDDNVEIIIINDGSTDNTSKVISKYIINNEIVCIEYFNNRGVNYARNRGIEKATGDYIIFLDSDDYLVDYALEKIRFCLTNYNKYEHFLFLVYNENKAKNFILEECNYADWLSNKYSGDYTHLISSNLIKKYPFFEDFMDAEILNWYRIYRENSPQIIINEKIVVVELKRSDSLMYRLKLTNKNAISDKYLSNDLFIKLYLNDFIKYKMNRIFRIIYQNIILGIILKKFKENFKYFKILKSNSRCIYPFKIINNHFFSKLFFLLVCSKSKLF